MGYTYRKYPPEFVTKFPHGPNKLYRAWYDMHKRCKPGCREARNYYDKGIRVCAEWNYWPTFAVWARTHGWAEGLEIDRIDGKLGYCPDNCRMATQKEQVANRDKVLVSRSGRIAQRKLHAKPFICVETGQQFSTQSEAAEITGLCRSAIGNALLGVSKICGGFHWRYINMNNSTKEAYVENHVSS